jgi:hypothetical protein
MIEQVPIDNSELLPGCAEVLVSDADLTLL